MTSGQKLDLREIIFVVGFLILNLLMPPSSADTLCSDGTVSKSSGSGTCSWHGGIAGNTTKKNTGFGYNDPYSSSSKKNTGFGYNDPYSSTTRSKSSLSCSYIDRSRGRC